MYVDVSTSDSQVVSKDPQKQYNINKKNNI